MGRKLEQWEKEKKENRKYFKSPKLSLLEMLSAGKEKLEGEEVEECFSAQGALPRAVAGGICSCNQRGAEPEGEKWSEKVAGSGDEMMKMKRENEREKEGGWIGEKNGGGGDSRWQEGRMRKKSRKRGGEKMEKRECEK